MNNSLMSAWQNLRFGTDYFRSNQDNTRSEELVNTQHFVFNIHWPSYVRKRPNLTDFMCCLSSIQPWLCGSRSKSYYLLLEFCDNQSINLVISRWRDEQGDLLACDGNQSNFGWWICLSRWVVTLTQCLAHNNAGLTRIHSLFPTRVQPTTGTVDRGRQTSQESSCLRGIEWARPSFLAESNQFNIIAAYVRQG